jgi:hypothetical protein
MLSLSLSLGLSLTVLGTVLELDGLLRWNWIGLGVLLYWSVFVLECIRTGVYLYWS